MKIDDKIKYLDLFLFLYSNPNANTEKIMAKLDKKYQATNKLLKKLREKNYLERSKRIGELGGAEWEYSLTESVVKFLKNLTSFLKNTMKIKEAKSDQEVIRIITEFYDALPDLITKSELNLNDQKIVQLKANVKKYFYKKFGIDLS